MATNFKDHLLNSLDQLPRKINSFIRLYSIDYMREKGLYWSAFFLTASVLVVLFFVGLFWSYEPAPINVQENAQLRLEKLNTVGGKYQLVTGFTTTNTLISVAQTLMQKPGGFLRNDIAPPGVWLDNMPNWEFGVLKQVRDLNRVLRNDLSMSQTTSTEDEALKKAEPAFNYDAGKWFQYPSSEKSYLSGIKHLDDYLVRLSDQKQNNAQFFARADNLVDWLSVVEKRLGSLSQRLSASVGQARINTDLAGDAAAEKSFSTPAQIEIKTPWLEIDDIFYEARGTTWALIAFFIAIEIDFKSVLENKNAVVNFKQIIRELEATQDPVWSPMILNGSGFGIVTNHSLIMSSYISRANAAIIDLKRLLADG